MAKKRLKTLAEMADVDTRRWDNSAHHKEFWETKDLEKRVADNKTLTDDQRALILKHGPTTIRLRIEAERVAAAAQKSRNKSNQNLKSVPEVPDNEIRKALKKFETYIEAADALGITARQLRERRKKLE